MPEDRLRILSPSQNRTCEHHLAYGSSSSNNLSVKANFKFAKILRFLLLVIQIIPLIACYAQPNDVYDTK